MLVYLSLTFDIYTNLEQISKTLLRLPSKGHKATANLESRNAAFNVPETKNLLRAKAAILIQETPEWPASSKTKKLNKGGKKLNWPSRNFFSRKKFFVTFDEQSDFEQEIFINVSITFPNQ